MKTPVFAAEPAARIEEAGIVAVLVLEDAHLATPLARALLAGGIRAMELTLRTPAALDALRAIRAEVPGMLAGVGTILSPEQVVAAKESGAEFGVSPGFRRAVIDAAIEVGLPFAPGVATPTDIEAALDAGCRLMKFFPAEPMGGLPYLRAIAAPYLHLGVRFIPLGGIHSKNMGAYLAGSMVLAIGGSWLAPKELLASGDWEGITRLASEASAIVASAKSPDSTQFSSPTK